MKIAISTATDQLDGPFDPRFGRGAFFCIVDTDSGAFQAHANAGLQATGGAGVQAAQFVANQGVQVVISGDFGPNAHMTLAAAGIAMYLAPSGEALTGREMLDRFQAGQLKQASAPTGPGHRHR